MKEVQLTKGRVALVDDEDFEWLNQFNWCFQGGYATRWKSKKRGEDTGSKNFCMHREIMNLGDLQETGKEVDHINGNKLDNQRNNLRIATRAENAKNLKSQNNPISGYRGVYQSGNKWHARIYIDGLQKYLGSFKNPQSAFIAYEEEARKSYGEFRRVE